ncbi:type IV pilus assembly protein PilW [Paucimonas lemoignei]|uniref:Type IV pilus assembly protein PilW n=2 Tax=Paucimonas lemoignei TaxID=29443 RepID=A0A4R3HW66_PAULE|nr:type IV pilus assembly protein PilW [Paucimonas lemoignei]
MVAVTIGLITMLVIVQVLQVSEYRRKTINAGADSTVNAALALYTIERDGKNAGFGLSTVKSSLGCQVRGKYGTTDVNFSLVPVTIVDGTAGAPDKIRFIASNKVGAALPTMISSSFNKIDPYFGVESDLGVAVGDMLIVVPATWTPTTNWCSLFQATPANAGEKNTVRMDTAASNWNHVGSSVGNIFPAIGYDVGSYLLNVGTLTDRTYKISASKSLVMDEYDISTNIPNTTELFPNIVQLQAVYGRDTTTPPDNIVDLWSATAPASAAEWQQVRAIRVALVARGDVQEVAVTLDGDVAASTCNSLTPHPAAVCWKPDPAGNGVKIDVSAGEPNWRNYRYRVMETTIPVRNMIWGE